MNLYLEALERVDYIISTLENSEDVKKLKVCKEKLYHDHSLLEEIERIKEETYSSEYVERKNQIIQNETFSEWRSMEKDLYFLVQAINQKLQLLVKEVNDENYQWNIERKND